MSVWIGRKLAQVLRDDRGAEVMEYALVMGMVALVAIGPMQAVGHKVLQYWRAIDAAMGP
jgi:Flp pilus assembly pilin Flp